MRIGFNLEYQTTFGEELVLNILSEGKTEQHKMGDHRRLPLDMRTEQGREDQHTHRLLLLCHAR